MKMENDSFKSRLKKQTWEDPNYYRGNLKETKAVFYNNPALIKLLEYCRSSKSILDCGCGDGRIIEILWRKGAKFWGIDLSAVSVKKGKQRLKNRENVTLIQGDIEKIEFASETFDLAYSVYTLEHLDRPEKVIREMIRVVKKGGYLIYVCPNYGSPLSFSPGSPPKGESLTSRAVKQFLRSHLYLFKKPRHLDWLKVEPLCLKEKRWQPDWDTVVEPYLQTLLVFLKRNKIEILESSSILQVEKKEKDSPLANQPSLRQKLLSASKKSVLWMGKIGLPPYKYFGPTLFVAGKKHI